MYKHILIATDGSDLGTRALDHGLRLAKAIDAKATVVTVTEPAAIIGAGHAAISGTVIDPIPELIEAQEEAARHVLQSAERAGQAAGVAVRTQLVSGSYPAEGIIAAAGDVGADLIVMGSHGRRGFGRLLLGSQTSNVLAQSKTPVLVTR